MDIFTYKQYKKILDKMKKTNRIYTFKEVSDNLASGILLRHDIDFDIDKAYSLSKIEEEENIRSTFFVLTTSDIYNPSSLNNRRLLYEMHSKGFEIGLHFDPSVYLNMNENELRNEVRQECNVLEDIIGNKIEAISLHCPSIHSQYPILKGYKNAYAEEFFNPEFYISDSCKDFRGKDLFDFIDKGRQHLIQVVLHPIHFSDIETDYIESFNYMFKSKINAFDSNVRINKTYNKEIGNEKLLYKFCEYISILGSEEK